VSAPHNPPYRAEIIGSFLRSPALKEKRAEFREGKLSPEDLRTFEDGEIRALVARQEELGLPVCTDGELRRGTYSDVFTTSGISGVSAEYVGLGDFAYSDGKGGVRTARVPVVRDKIRWTSSDNAKNFAFLRSVATKAMPKTTMPGPCYIYQRAGRANISTDVYPSLDAFWADLVAAYHKEMRALHEAGCRYLQLDDTAIAKLVDPKIQHGLEERGDDWRKLLEIYAHAINAVLDGAPEGMSVGIHLCRGNQAGHWQASGGYDLVSDYLFKRIRASFYFLEFDSPRAGTFEPLKALPEDKVVVLGLVSTKVADLEDRETLLRRLDEASALVPKDRLALSPQCGFSSSEPGNALTVDQQFAKVARIVEVAREFWG
jgi:5-methyltetrahydropteroyltriglutamate--homocysteine methyltransferase